MSLQPWNTYVPAALNSGTLPNFWLEPVGHLDWDWHLEWLNRLSYSATALDFRFQPEAAEVAAQALEARNLTVIEIRASSSESSRRWIAWSTECHFLKSALKSDSCLEAVWDISDPSLNPSDAAHLELWRESSLAVFTGTRSSEGLAPLFPRACRSPYWLDGWKKAPQIFHPAEMQVESDTRGSQKPLWSVIIPFRDRGPQLEQTLRSLSCMKPFDGAWELIVLDDNKPEHFSSLKKPPELPVCWIRVPRGKSEDYGKRDFRAGSMRNLGARYARGSRLLFLDSDIIIRPDFLERLNAQFEERAILQPCRWNLRPGLEVDGREAEKLREESDALLSYRGAWEDIQYAVQPWQELKFPWQWVSTFCLAVSRDFFEELGGFRDSFDQYGFEDTEFGYRAWQRGGRFLRLPESVFHQNHHREQVTRESRSASYENLFRWVLDPSIHAEFRNK